jgi:hypothetical protein
MPSLDSARLAQGFHVGDEMRRGVVAQFTVRSGSPGAALIEKNHAISPGIEIPAAHRGTPAAWPAMEKDDGNAARVAAFLPMERMHLVDRQPARFIRVDGGV